MSRLPEKRDWFVEVCGSLRTVADLFLWKEEEKMAEAVCKRSEIPVAKRWAVEDLYESREAWEAALEAVSKRVEIGRAHV